MKSFVTVLVMLVLALSSTVAKKAEEDPKECEGATRMALHSNANRHARSHLGTVMILFTMPPVCMEVLEGVDLLLDKSEKNSQTSIEVRRSHVITCFTPLSCKPLSRCIALRRRPSTNTAAENPSL